jgi:EmrB/QacA subfamily drug resistance transporter
MNEIHGGVNIRRSPGGAAFALTASLMSRGPVFTIVRIPPPLRAQARLPGLALALGAFLTQFDVTAVVVAMPSISHDLDLGIAGFAWVMDAYSLAFTATLSAAGALADRLGRRRVMLLGNAWFVAASVACGLAWDGPALWVARAAQGIGAAAVITGALALLASTYRDVEARAQAFAQMGIVSGVAMALGPTLGGALAAWLGWRWIFWANVPLCAVIAWAVPRLVGESRSVDARAIDWIGIALMTMTLGLVIASLLQSHATFAFAALGAIASVVTIVTFVVQQRRAAAPLFDPALLAKPAVVGIIGLLVAVSVGYWSVLIYLPLFLQETFGWTSGTAGLALMAATLPMLALPAIGGRLALHCGLRRLFAIGLAAMALGNLLLAAACLCPGGFARLALALVGMACIGSGAALAHPQLSGAIVAQMPPDQAGMASAMTITARQAGFAVGIAVLGAVLLPGAPGLGFAGLYAIAAAASAAGLAAAVCLLR